jgi:Protein of unknown function (DUF3987)
MNAPVLVSLADAERRQDNILPLYEAVAVGGAYPVDSLGKLLGSAASAIASKIRVPVSIAGQSVLAAASLEARANVLLPYGQTRPLSLYLITVAGSGDRKSSADNEALWPIRKREKALRETYAAEYSEWLIKKAAHAAQRRKVENDAKLTLSARELELRALGTEPIAPMHPILTAPDPTIEGLAKIWTNAPASLGLFSAEAGQFVGGHGMSPDHKLKTAAALSELWDGKGMRRLRAGDGLSILDGRRLATHLMLQPDAAAAFLGDGLLKDQGFLSRVLIAAPVSLSGTRLYRETKPEDDAAIRSYGARILSILESEWPLVEGQRCELDPPSLGMSDEAAAHWREYFDHIERQSGVGGDLDSIRDFAAKAAEQAARIAGVLTIISDPTALEIGVHEMRDAVVLTDWHVAECLRLTNANLVDKRLVRANRLLEWMKAQPAGAISLRHMLQYGPNGIRSKQKAEEALKILVDHGQILNDEKTQRYRLAAGVGP